MSNDGLYSITGASSLEKSTDYTPVKIGVLLISQS